MLLTRKSLINLPRFRMFSLDRANQQKKKHSPINLFARKTSSSQAKYKNLLSIRNRLLLWESFQLQQRLVFDERYLRSLRIDPSAFVGHPVKCEAVQSFVPGAPDFVSATDRVAAVTFPLSCLKERFQLSDKQLHTLVLLLEERYCKETGLVHIVGNNFPFYRQNLQLVKDSVSSAVGRCKSEGEDAFHDIPADVFQRQVVQECDRREKTDFASFFRLRPDQLRFSYPVPTQTPLPLQERDGD